jgi:hypothetical protein
MKKTDWLSSTYWALLAFAGFGLTAFSAASASADIVRITSINDSYDPNHPASIHVRPGDVVTFSADILNERDYQAAGANVEQFNWMADDRAADECQGTETDNCLTHSSFQLTNYGVSFYVPYNLGQSVTVTVVDAAQPGLVDSIELINDDFGSGYVPPTQIITTADQYDREKFDPDYALSGQGRWVIVKGLRYWVPYSYQVVANEEWRPYTHGYWSWSVGYGYTWVSYDPWGWATEHYGVWRHHETYGWIWRPFDDNHYEPHVVTFFDDENAHVGWYPYHEGFDEFYSHGRDEGFDDGFWDHEHIAVGFGGAGYLYHPGFVAVEFGHFRENNIHDFRLADGDRAFGTLIIRADGDHRFTRFPGGYDDLDRSHTWISQHVGGEIIIVRTTSIRSAGGAMIMRPEAAHAVPAVYGQVAHLNGFDRVTPVGSTIAAGKAASHNGRPEMVAPSTNGRGIVAPPRAIDPRTGAVNEIPPRAKTPISYNHGNPIAIHQPAPIQHQPAPLPVYHPGPAPAPRPTQPAPRPTQPAPRPTQPAPRPTQPAPRPTQPAPRPQPAPQPAPRPQPAPQPAPRPQPAPQPAPRPQPAPQPAPRPQPAPQPAPHPGPHH